MISKILEIINDLNTLYGKFPTYEKLSKILCVTKQAVDSSLGTIIKKYAEQRLPLIRKRITLDNEEE